MMTNSNANVRAVGSDSTSKHRFPWKWYLRDLSKVESNGRTVFSCFSCGGGSTMGYKLAGYEVLGNCEIDPKMMEIYQANHHPRFPHLMDVRDFAKLHDLPEELYHLDVLDGSPPCTTFSIAGQREKNWGKEKKFREGQKAQTLDDLSFVFLDVVERLRPKVVVMENVQGMTVGKAKGYINEIAKKFKAIGYDAQLFNLNAATMGVPQKRGRIFFIARRKDLELPKLVLDFHEPPIFFGEVRTPTGTQVGENTKTAWLLSKRRNGDKSLGDIQKRELGKDGWFNISLVSDDVVAPTVISSGGYHRMHDGNYFSDLDFVGVQTFPQDYKMLGQSAHYVCGMSVPPVMMANIAAEIYEQWLE